MMKKLSILKQLLIVIGVSISYLGFTQEQLNLDDAIKISLEKNYAIRLVKKSAEINENNLTIGNAGMLPQLNANGSFSNSNQDSKLELATGQTIDQKGNISNALKGSVDMNWTIFNGFGMFVSYSRLKEFKELGDIQVQIAIENSLNALISTFYECLRLQQDLESLEENLAISNERLKRVNDKAAFGAAVQLEVLKATVDRNADSSAYLQKLLNLNSVKRNLNFLMGREQTTNFVVTNTESIMTEYSWDILRETALKQNSSIQQGLKNKRVSELDYKMIKASRYPRVNMTANYGYNKSTADAGIMTLNQNVGLSAGLSASVNIFDGFRTRTQIQNAQVNMDIQQIQVEELQTELEMNLLNSWETFQNRLNIWKLELENYNTALMNFERTNESYKLGLVNSVELREAQLNLLRSKNSINSAYFQAKLAENQLLLLAGLLN